MLEINTLIILDVAASVIMAVLASLSQRLGEALKIAPLYRLFYVGIVLIITGAIAGAAASSAGSAGNALILFSLTIRFISGLLAVAASLRYWRWLFAEYFKI
jgi:hypothetical protein